MGKVYGNFEKNISYIEVVTQALKINKEIYGENHLEVI